MRFLKKFTVPLISGILILSLLPAPYAVAAESTQERLSFELSTYEHEDNKLTLIGLFTNNTDDLDVYNLRDATVTVTDKAGTQITVIECYSESLGEVLLNPGETWEYTIVRNVDGLSDGEFNLKSVTAALTCGYSYKTHETSGCTLCSDWGERDYKTRDTGISSSLAAKLKSALESETAAETASASSGDDSSSSSSSSSWKTTCSKCGGTGKLTCTTCDGTGYKEITKYKLCFVEHHTDCPHYKDSSKSCDGCHKRNDSYTQKQSCGVCMGKKTITCTRCSGTGKAF